MLVRNSNPARLMQGIGGFGAVCLLLWVLFSFNSHRLPSQLSDHIPGNPGAPQPANSTLDFGAILYISMPYRTDRQDAISLMAAATGLKLIHIPGVSGDDINQKAEPDEMPEELRGNRLGCWRAHANAWKYIIDNDLGSALILEDDLDWDLNIKDIMGLWNWQLRFNNTIRWGANVQQGWKEKCPYGCDWDELFMGQCSNSPNPARLDLMQTWHDPHGPDFSTINPTFKKELALWNISGDAANQLRVSSPVWAPLCTMGYALSRRGAMRMLYQNSYMGLDSPVDLAIIHKNKAGKLNGYTMTPPVIGAWRVGGHKDSDLMPGVEKQPSKGNKDGVSYGLQTSVRKALTTMLEKDFWKDVEKVEAKTE